MGTDRANVVSGYINNSWSAGVVIDDCPECYSNTSQEQAC